MAILKTPIGCVKESLLYQIAKRYRTTVGELKRLNKLVTDTIVSGSKLIIKN